MESVAMLSNPELMNGFQELIGDSDLAIVKRTIRVFSNLYHNAFRLVSLNELEEEILLNAWEPVKNVVEQLLSMISTCENEGVLLHLVRFVESSVTAHLMYDLSAKLEVAQKGREIIKKGLKALKDLVTTPYVGGAVFIIAVRGLITIACLCPDLHEPATDLIARQMNMLPPTLFDHNVRSFHKMLQRNLFVLFKKIESLTLKEKLIEMMVKAGVPRKMLNHLAPEIESRKRSPVYPDDGRHSPPNKRVRGEQEEEKKSITSNAGLLKNMSPEEIVRASSDPRLITRSPPSQKSSEPYLQQDIRTQEKSNKLEKKSFSPEERELALTESLTLPNICTLIFDGLENLPTSLPEYFVKELDEKRLVHENLELMKKRLVSLLYKELSGEHLDSIVQSRSSNAPQHKDLFSLTKPAELASSSSNSTPSSTPSSTPPLSDTDLRQHLQKSKKVSDVDMRLMDPRLACRDPRMVKNVGRDPRLSKDPDPRSGHIKDPRIPTEESRDPRSTNAKFDSIAHKSNETQENTRRGIASPPLSEAKEQRSFNRTKDPRIRCDKSESKQPFENLKAERKDPRLSFNDKRSQKKDPRISHYGSRVTSFEPRSSRDMSGYKNERFNNALLPIPSGPHANNNFRMGPDSRDAHINNLSFPPKDMQVPFGTPFHFSNDNPNNPHAMFPSGGMMAPHFSQAGPPLTQQGPPPLMGNCPPMPWQGNFQQPGEATPLLLSQPMTSPPQGGFIHSPMLNM